MRTSHLAPILLASCCSTSGSGRPTLSHLSRDPTPPALPTARRNAIRPPARTAARAPGRACWPSCPARKPERARPRPGGAASNPELEAAISQWSQSSEGSVLIERLYDAEQGSQLTTVFDRLDIVEDVRGQVQEQLRELYRLGFDHPDAYEQESQRIWGNLSNLLGRIPHPARTRDLLGRYQPPAGDPGSPGGARRAAGTGPAPIPDASAERGEPAAGPAGERRCRHLSGEPARLYPAGAESSRSFLNPDQLKVVQDMLELDLVRQEVSVQMEAIYQRFQPAS